MSYNNYYLKYVHCQLANLPTCQLPHRFLHADTRLHRCNLLYAYKYLISLRIGVVKSADPKKPLAPNLYYIEIKKSYVKRNSFVAGVGPEPTTSGL